ncbi:MAG: hypothetical protein K2X93_28880 [Candidatus Obscuribacterales bacterium]|nr:hypothetical protein [Candidatus Obscuribacterales bacterium]
MENKSRYKSEFGWSIALPETWKRLSRTNPDDRTPIASFSTPEDWSLSLNWMVSPRGCDDDTVTAFDIATMLPGRVELMEASNVVNQIFPLVGKLIRAAAIVMPDGQRALEVVEAIGSPGNPVERLGYSLIFPRRVRGEYRNKVHFQRMSFFAPQEVFHDRIPEVAIAVRSFHYAQRAA